MYERAQAVPRRQLLVGRPRSSAAARCQSRLEAIRNLPTSHGIFDPKERMSSSGEQGKRPVPGPVATANRREEETGEPSAEAEVVVAMPPKKPTRFVCEICGDVFLRKQNLKLHRRGHGERRPFTVAPGAMGPGSSSHVTSSSVHRQDRDSFLKHGPLSDPVVPSMGVDTAATSALRLHALLPSLQARDRGGSAYSVPSGFCMSIEDMKQIWKVGDSADGGSSSDWKRGCVASACTRPELPPRSSLSRPVILATALAHAVAYEHACESCREFLNKRGR